MFHIHKQIVFSNFYSYPGYFKRISLHLPELRHRLRCARYLRSLNSLLWQDWFFKKKILRFAPYLVAIIGILIFSLYLTGKTGFIGKIISGTFSYRFIGSVMAIRLYGVNLTGHYLDKLGETLFIDGQWGTFWLDFAYVRVLVEFGIIGALIFTVILIHSIRSMIRNRDYSSLILITIVLFYGLSEWGAFSALTAFPLLLTTIPSPIKASMRCIKTEKNADSWKIIPTTIQRKTSFLTN